MTRAGILVAIGAVFFFVGLVYPRSVRHSRHSFDAMIRRTIELVHFNGEFTAYGESQLGLYR